MKKFTVKKPDGTEVVLDHDKLVIGYNNREIDPGWPAKPQGAPQWTQVGVLIGVGSAGGSVGATAPSQAQGAQEPDAAGSISASLWGRYRDAYLVARATAAIGGAVKGIGIGLGILIVLGAVGLATQNQGAQSAAYLIGGLLAAAVVGVPLYVLGILVAAQGQVLKATLDAAVHTSPFLEKQDMARIMSL